MVTRICILTIPGRGSLTGKVTTGNPTTDVPIEYTGDQSLLSRPWPAASPAFLKVIFTNIAAKQGGTVTVHDEGQYDLWDE